MTLPDPRLHAFRSDLADARLRGRVVADRFVEGIQYQVNVPLVPVHKAPRTDAMQLTQGMLGETLLVFENSDGWAFTQLEGDGYVGYVAADALTEDILVPTHRVAVPSTFMYPAPDMKTQPAIGITLNAQVSVVADDGRFSRLANGRYVFSRHLKPMGVPELDFVAVAEQFRHVPYLWGGKSVKGLDCSGLVQLALESCGITAPRDSDMQQASLGVPLLVNDLDGLNRGDLVFWQGHVGIMSDAHTLLHANGHHMMVVAEPLREAAARIAGIYGEITSIRRLQ